MHEFKFGWINDWHRDTSYQTWWADYTGTVNEVIDTLFGCHQWCHAPCGVQCYDGNTRIIDGNPETRTCQSLDDLWTSDAYQRTSFLSRNHKRNCWGINTLSGAVRVEGPTSVTWNVNSETAIKRNFRQTFILCPTWTLNTVAVSVPFVYLVWEVALCDFVTTAGEKFCYSGVTFIWPTWNFALQRRGTLFTWLVS